MARFLTASVVLLFCLIAVPAHGAAEPASSITLSQSLDKSEMAFEDSANFVITLTWPGSQMNYFFDKPLQPALENLKVREFSSSVSSTGQGPSEVTTKRFTFTLVPTGSGQGHIAPVTVHYLNYPDTTIEGQLVTEAMSVTIAAARPRPKRGSGFLGVPYIAWGALTGLAIVGLVAVGYNRTRRRQPIAPVQTPVDVVLDKLTALAAESGNDLKRFQTGLYKLLTWFVGEKYGLNLSGKSADEIASTIQESQMPADQKARITSWLLRADREKFTPTTPMPGETLRLGTEVRQFFENMKLRA